MRARTEKLWARGRPKDRHCFAIMTLLSAALLSHKYASHLTRFRNDRLGHPLWSDDGIRNDDTRDETLDIGNYMYT